MFQLEDSTTSFNLDNYMVSFETGLPKSVYKMAKILGDGGIVSGNGFLEGRIAKISRVFTKWEESDRDSFINWFNRPPYETMYLRRQTSSFNGKQECKNSLGGGETYNVRNYNVGKEIEFEMYMENPYFESTTVTTTSVAIASSALVTGTVTINGNKVYPNFEITSTKAVTQFEVKTAEGYGFHVDYTFTAGDTIVVSTSGSELSLTVNGNYLYGYFSANSTPFELKNGTNNLYIKADVGTLLIKYYERHL